MSTPVEFFIVDYYLTIESVGKVSYLSVCSRDEAVDADRNKISKPLMRLAKFSNKTHALEFAKIFSLLVDDAMAGWNARLLAEAPGHAVPLDVASRASMQDPLAIEHIFKISQRIRKQQDGIHKPEKKEDTAPEL